MTTDLPKLARYVAGLSETDPRFGGNAFPEAFLKQAVMLSCVSAFPAQNIDLASWGCLEPCMMSLSSASTLQKLKKGLRFRL